MIVPSVSSGAHGITTRWLLHSGVRFGSVDRVWTRSKSKCMSEWGVAIGNRIMWRLSWETMYTSMEVCSTFLATEAGKDPL